MRRLAFEAFGQSETESAQSRRPERRIENEGGGGAGQIVELAFIFIVDCRSEWAKTCRL